MQSAEAPPPFLESHSPVEVPSFLVYLGLFMTYLPHPSFSLGEQTLISQQNFFLEKASLAPNLKFKTFWAMTLPGTVSASSKWAQSPVECAYPLSGNSES